MEALCVSVKEDSASSWVLTRNSDPMYTGDQLIDAYIFGKRNAIETTKRIIDDALNNNINKSGDISAGLLRLLRGNNYHSADAYLRINSIDKFDILITIPESEMIGDDFLDIYNIVSDIETKNRDKYYDLLISFCPLNDNFEEINVLADGFLLKLAKNGK